MKALVVYDSAYGNTAQVAQAIGSALGPKEVVTVRQVGSVQPEQLAGVNLLIVGSPTQGFRPTQAITDFLKGSLPHDLKGIRVAAFDTRISAGDVKPAFLGFIVNMGGYAAKPIAESLKEHGGELVTAPEGFFVEGKEGPLKAGELERAADWAKHMVTTQ